jgi:spore germination cell wall hydrolase CwlJ-like protein
MRAARRRTMTAVFATLVVVVIVLALVIGSSLGGSRLVGTPGALPPGFVPPPVEPVELMALAPADAQAANATQPFVTGNFPSAAPFRFTGDSIASARATDCLAAAVLYEAGDDGEGQRAVAQVIINRARHPAYPKSICGVVFQGSERRTGCQFTFTCDGALSRRYSDGAWARARGIAIDALTGAVYRPVGLATHYHTDWVRPYWSPSLEKLAQVGTHLFFRWPGFWGSPRAMVGSLSGQEPAIAKLGLLSATHAAGLSPETLAELSASPVVTPAVVAAAVASVIPRRNLELGDTIILTLERGQTPETFPAIAEAACGGRAYCKVMGWSNPGLAPQSEAMTDMARAAMSFSYLRDERAGLERALWNCDEYARDQATQCMRRGGP